MRSGKAWEETVRMLNDLFKLHEQHQQHVTSGDTQAAAEVLASSAVLCERLLLFLDGAQHLRASRAEREKIVSKLKVPEQLGRACMLPPAVLSDTCSVQLLLAAYSSLHCLAYWAADNRLWLEDAAVNAQSTQEQSGAAACANSLLQQLRDVGLSQHYTALMLAVAKQLVAEQAAACRGPAASSASTQRFCALLRLSDVLLKAQWLFDSLRYHSSVPTRSAAVATAAAGNELALTVLGCTTGWFTQQQQQQQQQQPSLEDSIWPFVNTALQYMQQANTLEALGELEAPEARLALPSATRTCSMLAVLNLYCARLQSLPLPAVEGTGTASSSSAGSSSSGSTLHAAGAAAPTAVGYAGASDGWVWQVASTNLQQLPDAAPVLAKCMGLSKLQLACIAAHMLRSGTAAVDMAVLLDTWESVLLEAAEVSSQQLGPLEVVQGFARLELSRLLLGWLAALPSTGQQFVSRCARAVYCTHLALQAFADWDWHLRQDEQQDESQQQEQARQQQQLMRLLSPWADRAMPALLSTMSGALVRARAEATGPASSSGGGGNSSSSSSSCGSGNGASGGSSSGTTAASSGGSASGGPGVMLSLLEALTNCVLLLDDLRDATAVKAGSGLEFAPVWGAHGVEVVSLLESYARLLLFLGGAGVENATHGAVEALVDFCDHSSMKLLALAQQVERLPDAEPPACDRRFQALYPGRLLSLLLSVLKLASSLGAAEQRLCFCLAAANTCAEMVSECIKLGPQPLASSSSSAEVVAAEQSAAASCAVWCPWLVLLGRCCWYASEHLSGVAALDSNTMQELDTLQGHIVCRLQPEMWQAQGMLAPASATRANLQPVLEELSSLEGVLAGFFVEQPPGIAAADDAARPVYPLAADLLADGVQQLRVFGEAASAIPVAAFCNNPGCWTVRGQSEVGLVSGKSCLCSRCRVARYCSKSCQSLHWAVHKPVCKALAAESAAGGSA